MDEPILQLIFGPVLNALIQGFEGLSVDNGLFVVYV
jgi:hypothetical protein